MNSTSDRILAATCAESVVDRIEHAGRILSVLDEVRRKELAPGGSARLSPKRGSGGTGLAPATRSVQVPV